MQGRFRVASQLLWLMLMLAPHSADHRVGSRKVQVSPLTGAISPPVCSSQMAPGYAVAVMGIDFTLRYFYKVLLDLLPICNQDKGNKIR